MFSAYSSKPVSGALFVFVLAAVWWPGPAKSRGRGHGPVRPLSLSHGKEGVKQCKCLPANVVAAEKQALQAGQEVQLSLNR